MTDNPFFEPWTTPFGLPPFDRILPEHFPPAFDRGMEEELAEMEAIANQAEPPSFANTLEAMERSGRLLGRVAQVFYNLTASNTNDALDAVARDYAPKLAQHGMRVALNAALFGRIAELYRRRTELGLVIDQQRLLDRRYRGFVRSGALLDAGQKERMTAISQRLASLHTAFGQNLLHDEKIWSLTLGEQDLDGLPSFFRSAAAEAAKERGIDGYCVTLARSSVEPFLTFSARRDLRRIAYDAWRMRGAQDGEHDNRPLIREILALRAEQARLLGFDTYAAYKLDDSMAGDVESAEALLLKVWQPAKHKAAVEKAALDTIARADGLNAGIAAWDWRYYAEKLRQEKYDLDESEVKPYFILDNMVQAAFDVAGRLFGLRFTEQSGLALYHPDVRAYEVQDIEGATVGLFLHDNFARSGKHSGAWMSSYRDQENLDGAVTPIVVNNNNFAKGTPTLLSFDDARTLFHEFGHGLHGLLSRVRYPSQSGTSVKRDFVEFPSQLYEHWMSAPEILRRYAVHYQTGEPIPEALLQKLLDARNFNQGFATVEYTAAALLDLDFHRRAVEEAFDATAAESEIMAKLGVPEEIGVRHRPAHFGHLFSGSGYAAGYYAYMWAETLDADGYEAFESTGDLFDPALASRLKEIYSAGDTRDPMELYVAFRGRNPETEALLRQRGLAAE